MYILTSFKICKFYISNPIKKKIKLLCYKIKLFVFVAAATMATGTTNQSVWAINWLTKGR